MERITISYDVSASVEDVIILGRIASSHGYSGDVHRLLADHGRAILARLNDYRCVRCAQPLRVTDLGFGSHGLCANCKATPLGVSA
jgi:hypothetical protein